MNRKWLWLYLTCLAVVALLADVAWYYPQLPQQVPLHFNGAGQPDRWGAKQELLAVTLAVMAILAAVLTPSVYLMKVLPASLINMPRRDYWLAPERAASTRRMMMDRMGWIVCATVVLMCYLFHSSLHAAFQQPPKMDSPLAALVVYLVFTALWLAELMWRFYRRPE